MIRALVACAGMFGGLMAAQAQDSRPADSSGKPLPGVKDPALAKELTRRVAVDQAARKDLINFMAEHKIAGTVDPMKMGDKIAADYKARIARVRDADRDNIKWLKEIVAKQGWPGKSLVGSAGSQNAWLLVQHADADRDFQESCLKKMEAMPRGEIEPKNLAYLTDRVLVGRGKKQKYGTQAVFQNGKAVASPVEDPDNVDARRKSVGLQPLADYLKIIEQVYKTPQKADAAKTKEKGG